MYIFIYIGRERERIERGSKNNKRFILVLWKNNIQMIGFPIGPSSTIQKQKFTSLTPYIQGVQKNIARIEILV